MAASSNTTLSSRTIRSSVPTWRRTATFSSLIHSTRIYEPGAVLRLTLTPRGKPADHHNNAGNINNVLFNAGTDGKLILFLNANMCPTEYMLPRTLSFMLEETRDHDTEHTSVVNDDGRWTRHGGITATSPSSTRLKDFSASIRKISWQLVIHFFTTVLCRTETGLE